MSSHLRPIARRADQLCAVSDEFYDQIQRDVLRRHFDANELPFIERELTVLRAKAFEVKFPDAKARTFLPLASDIPSSAMTFEFKVFTPVGAAAVINPKAGVPRLEVGARSVTARIVPVGIAYAFTVQELRESARVGSQLQTIKPRLARETVERGIDELLAFGDLVNTSGQDALPLWGFANNTDVVNLGLETFSYWMDNGDSGLTMLAELSNMVDEVSTRSKGMYTCSDLLLPLSRYNYAASKPFSESIGESVLAVFRKNHPEVNVRPWEKLETAGASSKPRAIAYAKSAEVVEAVIPQEFEMMPPEREGFEMVTDCWATCGGVKIYQPSAVVYADGATT